MLSAFVLILAAFVASCGGGGGAATGIQPLAPPPAPSLAQFAGNLGGAGNSDGSGAEARFNQPKGVAVDSAGNIFVADSGNNTIRKITPAGVVTTFAGSAFESGSADGAGAEARFNFPSGIATDSAGNVYVADSRNNTIRKITPAGVVSTLAGSAGMSGSVEGTGADARFDFPSGLAVDGAGDIYVADTSNNRIRKITAAGVVSAFAGTGKYGSADGSGEAASFALCPDPQQTLISRECVAVDLATDSAGNVYVPDYYNSTIRKITLAGVVSTLAGSFASPRGVATDSANNIYLAEAASSTIRKITAAGVVSTLAGTSGVLGSTDGSGANAQFRFCGALSITHLHCSGGSLATDSTGNVYVADTFNNTIRTIAPAGVVTTLAGSAAVAGSADGIGAMARFNYPGGVATDGAGNIFVSDSGNDTIRKVTPTGTVSTLAGSTGVPGSADGVGAMARFNFPTGVATDSTGNVYVADTLNHTIRKITPAGVVTTLAGSAFVAGSADGIGAMARFNFPTGVATDSTGNVYVADTVNNTIRTITAAGVVTTLAGSAVIAGSADGIGAMARFNYPGGVATDSAGNVYVADTFNNTIRTITAAGVVTTLAGSAVVAGSADGIGATARFNDPTGVATDGAGNIFVSDSGNDTIRKVTPTGLVTTIAGQAGRSGFTPGILPAVLSSPSGIAVRGGTLYVTLYNGVAEVTGLP